MRNYSTATCYTFSDDPIVQTFHQIDVPKGGFAHSHVLHVILGASAMHLAHFRPSKRNFYQEHAEKALPYWISHCIEAPPRSYSGNSHSLFLFASFCSSYILARGPQPGNFLLFEDNGPAEWLTLFRGIRSVLDLYAEDIKKGISAPLLRINNSATAQSCVALSATETDQLARLKDLVNETASTPEDQMTLFEAIDNLQSLLLSRYDGKGRKSKFQQRSIGIWLYKYLEEFTTLLQKHQPAALAIFAHAYLPWNDLGSSWHIY
jgi:hypothetical protein